MTPTSEVPEALVARVRAICVGLEGAAEHQAWTGVACRVGRTTFAHLVQIAEGCPGGPGSSASS